MKAFGRMMELMASTGTCLSGLLIALVLAPGTQLGPFGWLLAVIGALGVVAFVVLPQRT